MSTASRLYGIRVGCVRCGKEARWIVLAFPVCDDCKNSAKRRTVRS